MTKIWRIVLTHVGRENESWAKLFKTLAKLFKSWAKLFKTLAKLLIVWQKISSCLVISWSKKCKISIVSSSIEARPWGSVYIISINPKDASPKVGNSFDPFLKIFSLGLNPELLTRNTSRARGIHPHWSTASRSSDPGFRVVPRSSYSKNRETWYFERGSRFKCHRDIQSWFQMTTSFLAIAEHCINM